MRSGRPPRGLKHVDDLPGDPAGKEKLRVILATLSGEVSLAEACTQLGVSETRFLQLRRQGLEAALAALGRGPAGRPAKEISPETAQVSALQQEVKELKHRLVLEEVRTELALVMPHLVEAGRKATAKKKSRRKKKGRKHGRP